MRKPAWLFTCRHTFEPTLCDELRGLAGVCAAQPLLPGLVHAVVDASVSPDVAGLARLDPVYALQVLPAAVELHAPSIRGIAETVAALALPVIAAGDGTWDVHALVPAMLKGTPRPPMLRRATLVAEALAEVVRDRQRRLARLRAPGGRNLASLVQILLIDAETVWASAAPVLPLPPAASWPSTLPAGLAEVADDFVAPASSFRKLIEAFACMAQQPRPGETAVDLGACPGGWTRVLRTCGARVTAVDRSPLAPHLMADPEVRFVAGDAFAFRPPAPVDWLVSDIIAYPERVTELLDAWCGARLARRFVVQMKFKRGPDFDELGRALAVARGHGWHARARHFFNDKNEVTLMGVAGNRL